MPEGAVTALRIFFTGDFRVGYFLSLLSRRCSANCSVMIAPRFIAWLCVVAFLAVFSSLTHATTEKWAVSNNSALTAGQMGATFQGGGSDPVALILAQCGVLGGDHIVGGAYVTVTSTDDKYTGACYNSSGGGIASLYAKRFYNCAAYGADWYNALGGCAPVVPPDPCADRAAGSSASGSGFFDFGTNPDKAGVGGAGNVTCSDGCLAVFAGVFPAGVSLENGIAHYFAQGSYKYAGPGNSCSSSDAGEPDSALPPNTCPAGQVVANVTDGVKSHKTCIDLENGNENNPNDQNNDGIPDSCQPGTRTTADGWTVTTSWNAGSSTCTQHGEKSGQTDRDWSGSPTDPGIPFEDPNPPGDGPGNPTNDPIKDFCKNNPQSPLCTKSATGGSCSSFTCSGDAATCAIAKATQDVKCAFDNTKTLSDVVTDAGLGSSSKSAFLSSVGSTSTDIGSMLQTNQRDLTGSCPAPIAIATPWKSVSVSFSPLCSIAEIIGVMMMLAATFVSVRLLAGGAG